jgi:hypothetical protein
MLARICTPRESDGRLARGIGPISLTAEPPLGKTPRQAQRTRHECYADYPHYMFGTIAEGNHTVIRDLSGLTTLKP